MGRAAGVGDVRVGVQLKSWWEQPDHFDWLSGYLQIRGLSGPARRILAVVSMSLALVPVNVLWGPAPVDRMLMLVPALVAAVIGLALAVLWLTRWPTRRQSLVFAVTGAVTIGLGSLSQVNPVVGLMSCTALAVSGGYIAFFHTAGYMVLNVALAVGVGAVEAVRLAMAGDALLALTGYFLVLELNLAVPWAIQVVVRSLGMDLLRADRDPLTGLFNRRAFSDAAVGRIIASSDECAIAVAVVDLDRFKVINDNYGHSMGDAALVAVSRGLSAAGGASALVARHGGEEFLIADVMLPADVTEWSENLCRAVRKIDFPVTASVGTACMPLRVLDKERVDEVLLELIVAADIAMYCAKKSGGDRASHSSVNQNPGLLQE
jgi:diguanylate cyclase